MDLVIRHQGATTPIRCPTCRRPIQDEYVDAAPKWGMLHHNLKTYRQIGNHYKKRALAAEELLSNKNKYMAKLANELDELVQL